MWSAFSDSLILSTSFTVKSDLNEKGPNKCKLRTCYNIKFEFYDHIPHSMRGMIQLRCTWLLGKHNNHKLMPTESDKKVLICSGDTVSYRI